MRRRMTAALKTALLFFTLLRLTGLHSSSKGGGNTSGGNRSRKRNPPSPPTGRAMKRQAQQARSRQARPGGTAGAVKKQPRRKPFTPSDPKYQPKYKPRDSHNRATGITMRLKKDEFKGHPTDPTKAKGVPPGYNASEHHKGHLLGAQFGGSNTDPKNFVPLHHRTNTPRMRQIETRIKKLVNDSGKEVDYSVTPVYRTNSSDPVPTHVQIKVTDPTNGNVLYTHDLPNVKNPPPLQPHEIPNF